MLVAAGNFLLGGVSVHPIDSKKASRCHPGVLPSGVRNTLKRKCLTFSTDPRVRKCVKSNDLGIEGDILDENLPSLPVPSVATSMKTKG